MAHITVLDEKSLNFGDVKTILTSVKKRDTALSTRATKVEDYVNKFNVFDHTQIEEIKKKIEGLGLFRVKEKHINKILDLAPKDVDSLKIIFAGENLTLKQEDLQKVLECLD